MAVSKNSGSALNLRNDQRGKLTQSKRPVRPSDGNGVPQLSSALPEGWYRQIVLWHPVAEHPEEYESARPPKIAPVRLTITQVKLIRIQVLEVGVRYMPLSLGCNIGGDFVIRCHTGQQPESAIWHLLFKSAKEISNG